MEAITRAFQAYNQLGELSYGNLRQYVFLRRLLSENVFLYRNLILENPELIARIYTPGISDIIERFHLLRGFFASGPYVVSKDDVLLGEPVSKLNEQIFRIRAKERIKSIVSSFCVERYNSLAAASAEPAYENEDLPKLRKFLKNFIFVVTDGQRILGIGDQGQNGAEICSGKLACYFLGMGFNPGHLLPIGIDLGTNNKKLLNDKYYPGIKSKREDSNAITELVIEAISELEPALIQYEDFKGEKAWSLLDWHRKLDVPCFNDDSQGTGSVALAGVKWFLDKNPLGNILFYGAGGAAVGIAQQIEWMIDENYPGKEYKILMMDSAGLMYDGRKVKSKQGDVFSDFQKKYVLPNLSTGKRIDLKDAIDRFRPNIIIGTSTDRGAFSPERLAGCTRPTLLMALSNPTSKCEILFSETTTEQDLKDSVKKILTAFDGQVNIATGSPFPSVRYDNVEYKIGQANNLLVFPGLAYGTVFAGAKEISKSMFLAAAHGLTEFSDNYPSMARLGDACLEVAAHVAHAAINSQEVHPDVRHLKGKSIAEIRPYIKRSQWINRKDCRYSLDSVKRAADFDFEKVIPYLR